MNNNLNIIKELVVLVDNNGKPIGTQSKQKVHHANTPLHLAFSCYLFNQKGELIITQRASVKKVWPNVWTNSFCGHPMPKESFNNAIKRRASYELGINNVQNISKIIDYKYKTPPYNGIIENEICPVFIAFTDDINFTPNPKEVDDYKWLNKQDFYDFIKNNKNITSYWLNDQLSKMQDANIDIFLLAAQTI